MGPGLGAEGTAYNFAYAYATIVDGHAITPTGSDVTDDLRAVDDALPWEGEERPDDCECHEFEFLTIACLRCYLAGFRYQPFGFAPFSGTSGGC